MDQLAANLLDLLHALEGRNIPVMIGGGYGLYLKRQHLAATRERTLFRALPHPRATNDLDMFLRAEILSDLDRTREVRDVIIKLGYQPVEGVEFLQWKRQFSLGGVYQESRSMSSSVPSESTGRKSNSQRPKFGQRGKSNFTRTLSRKPF